jgi:ethanolamine ammonia-lyase small subunit
MLSEESRDALKASRTPAHDLLLVIGDGLSSHAVQRQSVGLIKALLPYLETLGISLAPVVLAHQSRVALGDDIGETLNSKAVAILIGERPGSPPGQPWRLSNMETRAQTAGVGAQLHFEHPPRGLNYDAAAFKLAWLLEQAFLRRLTGVKLKDESDNPALHGRVTHAFVSAPRALYRPG